MKYLLISCVLLAGCGAKKADCPFSEVYISKAYLRDTVYVHDTLSMYVDSFSKYNDLCIGYINNKKYKEMQPVWKIRDRWLDSAMKHLNH